MSYVLTKGLQSNTNTLTVNTIQPKNGNTLSVAGAVTLSDTVVIEQTLDVQGKTTLSDMVIINGGISGNTFVDTANTTSYELSSVDFSNARLDISEGFDTAYLMYYSPTTNNFYYVNSAPV